MNNSNKQRVFVWRSKWQNVRPMVIPPPSPRPFFSSPPNNVHTQCPFCHHRLMLSPATPTDYFVLLLNFQSIFAILHDHHQNNPRHQMMPILALLVPPSHSSAPNNFSSRTGKEGGSQSDSGIVQVDNSVGGPTTQPPSSTDCEEDTGTTEETEEEEEEEETTENSEGLKGGGGGWNRVVVSGESDWVKTSTSGGSGGWRKQQTTGRKQQQKHKGAGGIVNGTAAAAGPFGQCLAECLQNPPYGPRGDKVSASVVCPCVDGTTMASKKFNNNSKGKITTEEPFYYEYEAAPDITQFGPCNISVIADQAQRIVIDLLFYVAAAWVPFWAFLAIAVNMSFHQFGHHRWLDFYQELGFILLFLFMGVFVLKPQLDLLCVITTMVLLFCMVFILVIGFLQAYFASSLIKGTSLKDGHLPVAVNYVWPLVLSAIPVGLSIWLLRSDIASNRVHCFAPIHSALFWAFAVPAWLVWLLMLIRNQLSITACKQSRQAVDREQLYWARKSVKGTPLLLCWFLLTFFTQLFAVDLQLAWLCILFVAESLVLGPLLFLLHTHNHQKVNNGIFERTQMGLYRPCPIRRPIADVRQPPPPPPPPDAHHPTSASVSDSGAQQTVLPPSPAIHAAAVPTPKSSVQLPPVVIQPSPVVLPPPIAQPQSILKMRTQPGTETAGKSSGVEDQKAEADDGAEANAQVFYEWLTDSDERNLRESRRVLWPPRPI